MKLQPMVFIKRPKLAISEETDLIHGYRSLEIYDHFWLKKCFFFYNLLQLSITHFFMLINYNVIQFYEKNEVHHRESVRVQDYKEYIYIEHEE